MSRELLLLAERGVCTELDAKEKLRSAYRRFLDERESGRKDEAGKDLIRAISGNKAIAEDKIL